MCNKTLESVHSQIAMSLQRRLHFNSLMTLPCFMTYMLASKMDFVWNFLNILSFLLISHFKINWITTLPSLSIMKNPKCHKILQNHSALFIHVDENTLHFFPLYRYSIAVNFEHVPGFLPYISDTGVRVPERSVFSQFVNLAAFFHMVTIYVRYEQVRAEIKYRWNEEQFRGR